MKKSLLMALCLVFLGGVVFADAPFDLKITIMETLGIQVSPTELSEIIPIGDNVWVAGQSSDIEGGRNPGLYLNNVGILPWTATVILNDPGGLIYVTDVPDAIDEASLSLAFTSTTVFTDPIQIGEGTLYTAPLLTDPLNGNGGVGITPGSSVRASIRFGVFSECSLLGVEQVATLTFGCVE